MTKYKIGQIVTGVFFHKLSVLFLFDFVSHLCYNVDKPAGMEGGA
jgi:hypothetical protein